MKIFKVTITAVVLMAMIITQMHGQVKSTSPCKKPTAFNRFVVEEDIRYGQRVKKFALEALVDGKWQPLKDELVESGDGLVTHYSLWASTDWMWNVWPKANVWPLPISK